MSPLAKTASVALLLVAIVAAAASARHLTEAGALESSAAIHTHENHDPSANIPPACQEFIDEGVVKGCDLYTVQDDNETLVTLNRKFHLKRGLLQVINTQVADKDAKVYKGWQINIPKGAHM